MKFIFLIALFLDSPATWANTACTDAFGHVQTFEKDYEGGMAPEPGNVIRMTEIRIDGKVVSESKIYQGLNPEFGPIEMRFSEKKILHQHTDPSGATEIYSAKLTLIKSAGHLGDEAGIELPQATYVICQEDHFAMP